MKKWLDINLKNNVSKKILISVRSRNQHFAYLKSRPF
jgi:hypothetical protein